MSKLPAALLAVLLVASIPACTDDDGRAESSPPTTAASADAPSRPDGEPAGTGHCDDTDPTECLLPWPNDRFTRADPSTPTGRRLDIPTAGMPSNAGSVRIDPTEWNRNDGFSPASVGLITVPDVDVEASKLPPQTDIGASMRDGSGLIVVDVTAKQRVPAWAEVDPTVTEPGHRLLRVVPAVALAEGHRFAIGLKGLKRRDGSAIEPTPGFADLVEAPGDEDGEWLAELAKEGATASTLTAAWSFTVGSTDGLSGRLRHMWTETASKLGEGAPPFTVVTNEADGAARIVRGTFDMPKYLTGDGGPGTVLNNASDPNGIPTADATMKADFVCTVPAGATEPGPFVIYGHGLLNSRDEVLDIGRVGAASGIGFCALDYLGMSTADVPTVLGEFADLSRFRTQPDRMQQGHLGFLLLGRLLASPRGFVTDRAFQAPDGSPAIDHDRLSLLGASQGGILGGAASALSNDWSRVILAVGGAGYNLLLRRSIDFDKFAEPFAAAYPRPVDQALAIELIQQLWDRGENTAYSQHLVRDPYDGVTTPRTVLLLEAFGDHQVANVVTEKFARTLPVPRRAPTLAGGRSTDVDPFWGIDPIASLPDKGSGLVVWDFGTPTPPAAMEPPREGDDPHGKLGDVPQALALVAAFIEPGGAIIDVCNAEPCASPG